MKLAPAKRRLTLLPLLGIIFFSTSGGPFGMEDLVAAGPVLAVALLIATPLVWSVPAALIAAELGAMLPVEGGYYRWVSAALGRFWGFQMAWWNWISSFLDMAVYPTLFIKGLMYFQPNLPPALQWAIALAVILSSLFVNLAGAKPVGHSALAAFAIVNLPFLLLAAFGLPEVSIYNWFPTDHDGRLSNGSIGLALSVALWSYSGWEYVSTFAGEVEDPARTIPIATLAAVPLVALLYLLPLGVALGGSDWRIWHSETHTISQVAEQIVGPWLGGSIALAIMANSWSMYNSLLLSYSRLPVAMSADGLLPRWLSRLHSTRGTPIGSLILCSAIYAVFMLFNFRELVILNALITGITTLMLIVTLIVLRRARPDLARPFRVPGGRPGLWLAGLSLCGCVAALIAFTIIGQNETWRQAALASALLATGPIAYCWSSGFSLGRWR